MLIQHTLLDVVAIDALHPDALINYTQVIRGKREREKESGRGGKRERGEREGGGREGGRGTEAERKRERGREGGRC